MRWTIPENNSYFVTSVGLFVEVEETRCQDCGEPLLPIKCRWAGPTLQGWDVRCACGTFDAEIALNTSIVDLNGINRGFIKRIRMVTI